MIRGVNPLVDRASHFVIVADMNEHRNPIINRVFQTYGSCAAVAAAFGVSRQSVWAWKEIPLRHVKAIRDFTGIPLHELRPDVYEAPAKK